MVQGVISYTFVRHCINEMCHLRQVVMHVMCHMCSVRLMFHSSLEMQEASFLLCLFIFQVHTCSLKYVFANLRHQKYNLRLVFTKCRSYGSGGDRKSELMRKSQISFAKSSLGRAHPIPLRGGAGIPEPWPTYIYRERETLSHKADESRMIFFPSSPCTIAHVQLGATEG